MKPTCITFAGPYGSSKSPIAQFLSCQLGWPVFANDVVRNEVREDSKSSEFDRDEYTERVVTRLKDIAGRKQNFVYDASNDRMWLKFLENFEPDSYKIGVISIDLSAEFYKELLASKGYELSNEQIDKYLDDHRVFVENHKDVVICNLNDQNFSQRLDLSLQAVQSFIDS